MARVVVKVPAFEIEIEGQARNETEAWAMITDYHSDEILAKALDNGRIVRAEYDKNSA